MTAVTFISTILAVVIGIVPAVLIDNQRRAAESVLSEERDR